MSNYKQFTDERLMQFIVKGKENAFNELYARYADKMYRFFYNMLYQNENLANDFTQELFLKIIEKPDTFNPAYRFSTWFFSVANNMCKNEYRRNSRLPKMQVLEERSAITNQAQVFEKEQEKVIIEQAIAQLDVTHRSCFVLRYQQNLSVKVISEILECPEGTVKSRLYYATKKLARQLKPILHI